MRQEPPGEVKALIFDIKKMAVHDGPGIRTTVFFKGCPLDCLWCHSPESRKRYPELKFIEHLCHQCGACIEACPNDVHFFTESGKHDLRREDCLLCGACVEACPNEALDIIGREVPVTELAREILKDRHYFTKSGGGVTLSGGEVLAQVNAASELARLLKEAGVHVCVDTCGSVPFEHFERILPWTDLFLYDIKECNEERHRTATGVGVDRILDNLRRLDKAEKPVHLRCPLIPGVNLRSGFISYIAGLANDLDNVLEINLLPFHPYGKAKAAMIGEPYPLADTPVVEEEEAARWVKELRSLTSIPVTRG
jgi:glycyl-radical enzyme activating protein